MQILTCGIFGDGNTSVEESPTHFYTEEGEFLVSLIAITNEGCTDTAFAPAPIIAELAGRIRVPNAFTPSASGPSGRKCQKRCSIIWRVE